MKLRLNGRSDFIGDVHSVELVTDAGDRLALTERFLSRELAIVYTDTDDREQHIHLSGGIIDVMPKPGVTVNFSRD